MNEKRRSGSEHKTQEKMLANNETKVDYKRKECNQREPGKSQEISETRLRARKSLRTQRKSNREPTNSQQPAREKEGAYLELHPLTETGLWDFDHACNCCLVQVRGGRDEFLYALHKLAGVLRLY